MPDMFSQAGALRTGARNYKGELVGDGHARPVQGE